MTKEKKYLYVGANGMILSPIEIPGANGILKYTLTADEGKVLTRDGKTFLHATTVAADDVDNWKEVEGQE